MSKPFTPDLCELADNMGIAMYQRFTPVEASLFLRCPLETIQKLQNQQKLGFIQLPSDQVEFFGYQLLEYFLSHISEPANLHQSPVNQNNDRILRLEEVTQMVGLSRSTLWRMERKGDFPARIPLSSRNVGWRLVDVEKWIQNR